MEERCSVVVNGQQCGLVESHKGTCEIDIVSTGKFDLLIKKMRNRAHHIQLSRQRYVVSSDVYKGQMSMMEDFEECVNEVRDGN